MHIKTITKLLNIPYCKVSEVKEINEKEIHLKIEIEKTQIPKCSRCLREYQDNPHSSNEVKIEDISISGRKVYLYFRKRKYWCRDCQKIVIEALPWIFIRKTYRYAEQVYRLTGITTNSEAGWFLEVDDEVIYRIDKRMLEIKAKEKLDPIPAAVHLSIDEVSYKKYHRYLTNVIDTDKKMIIWNGKGRKTEVLNQYYEGIGEDNCKKIESVAIDGARTYISSTKKYAVNALIVYDKFHIVQKLNNTVDTVRKQQLQNARKNEDEELIRLTNCKQRFVLLKKKSRLSIKQGETLDRLYEINEPIYKAMLLKESFLEVFDCKNISEAQETLNGWLNKARNSDLFPFQELAKSFKDKMQYILNWFHKKISSSISEGFNNKIKRLKRMAYGYRDIDYFRLKIHQHCGLLNPKIATLS